MQKSKDLPWSYNLLIEGQFEPIKVELGDDPKWMEKYKKELDTAEQISLVPKDGINVVVPVITVALDGEKRWIFFSRVCGRIVGGTGKEIRLYCIGWQETYKNKNFKSLTWIYPNGVIEESDKPSYTHHYL